MVEHVPTGDLSRCPTDSFPLKCESNIKELSLSGAQDNLLFIFFTYCTNCHAVCLTAGLSRMRVEQTASNTQDDDKRC